MASQRYHVHEAGEGFRANPTPYHHFRLGIGETTARPFKLLVPILHDSFGDFALAVHLALQYAARFRHSLTTFAFFDNRPYKHDLIRLYPLPTKVMALRSRDAMAQINPLVFAPAHKLNGKYRSARDIVDDPRWHDMVFPWMHQQHVAHDLDMLPLRIPEGELSQLHAGLIGLGLDPNRWFACIHWREPTYRYKPIANLRDNDPQRYLPLIDHIIGMGGQVVRIGHPEMAHAAPRSGFVDLAVIPDSTLLQAYAASRARFCVSGTGGGACLMYLFGTPTASVDCIGWFDGSYGQYLLTQVLTTPEGQTLEQESLFESGLMNQRALEMAMAERPGFKLEQRSSAEIMAVADFMHRIIGDCPGWRTPVTPELEPDNRFVWPMRGGIRPRFIDL